MSQTILPVLSSLVPNSEPVLGSQTDNIIYELKGLSLNILTLKQPSALPVRILSIPSFCVDIHVHCFSHLYTDFINFLLVLYVMF